MNRRQLVFPVTVAIVAAASIVATVMVRKAHAAPGAAQAGGGSAAWVPYEITYKAYNKKPEWPQPILSGEIVRAVRSDGSSFESTTTYRLDRSIHNQQRQVKFAGGINIRADDRLSLMTATKNTSEDAARLRQSFDPARSCAVSMDGGQPPTGWTATAGETLSGYETYKVVVEAPSKTPRSRITIWRAPALGCAELRGFVETLDPSSGQVVQTYERQAADIRPGEPDPALFRLPNGFRNVSPIDFAAAEAQLCCRAKLTDANIANLQPGEDYFRQYRYDW